MLRKTLLFVLIINMGITACSSDDHNETENIQIKLSLVNENGEETTVFNVGENIYFQIKIVNESDNMISIPGKSAPNGSILSDVFGIFSMNGDLIGTPYDSLSEYDTEILPHQSLTLTCCWLMYPEKKAKDYYPFIVNKIKIPIEAGDYYTSCPLSIGNHDERYRVDFKIVDNSEANKVMKETTQELIGRWKMTKNSFGDIMNGNIYLEFDARLKARYEVHTVEGDLPIVESNFWLEYDWINMEDENTLFGHLLFKMSGNTRFPEGNDRFACTIKKSEMILMPDMGNYYYMDPTMYFARVN